MMQPGVGFTLKDLNDPFEVVKLLTSPVCVCVCTDQHLKRYNPDDRIMEGPVPRT